MFICSLEKKENSNVLNRQTQYGMHIKLKALFFILKHFSNTIFCNIIKSFVKCLLKLKKQKKEMPEDEFFFRIFIYKSEFRTVFKLFKLFSVFVWKKEDKIKKLYFLNKNMTQKILFSFYFNIHFYLPNTIELF